MSIAALERRFVSALRERSSTIATAADLIGRFSKMVKDKTPTHSTSGCARPRPAPWRRSLLASAAMRTRCVPR